MSRTFPSSFFWGAATSSHQVEGNNTNNDWWAWETAGKIPKSLAACDQFHRFETDFDIAQSLHHNTHRFSIEWSRIEPRFGTIDPAAIEHYRTLALALKKRGLEPVVTLHHFTNPQWFAELGGWENPDAVTYFLRYVELIVRSLSDCVSWWVTINEPTMLAYQGYVKGEWPPGIQSLWRSRRVFLNLAKAHVESYVKIKSIQKESHVGFAHNMIAFTPCRAHSVLDRMVTHLRDHFFNFYFLKAVVKRKKTMDFIGLNYYWRDYIHFDGLKWLGRVCSLEHHRDSGVRNMVGWEVYPQGLYDFLMKLAPFQLPILITENGMCTNNDHERWEYIASHLAAIHRAMEAGARVMGYLYWSLLDNFEWHEGYRPRFGLVEVDFNTQERRIRPSAQKLADVFRTSQLPL
jgi:beta-glucosidase